ncbi:MAG: sugar ABC transporter substrate-binding protein [Chloroflexi bacterium]|nr:sugar ABC transporter substrate-binding protein [Chloroflexota bacterium]
MKRIMILLVLILVAALVGACGGSAAAPTATTAPPAPTKAAAAPAATTAPAPTTAPAAAATTAPAAAATIAPTAAATPVRTAKGGIRKSSSAYKGTLNLWVLGYTPGNAFANPFDNAVSQFMIDNPDVKVVITGYPPNDEGFTKLTTALQSGQNIDLLRLPSDRLPQFVADDLVEPIDTYLTEADKADILPNILDVTRLKGGKAYAWPLWVVPMGIYVNKDVFAEAKVALPPKDWTWDQFVDAAKKTTFKRANGDQVYGFAGFIDPGVINTWGLWMNEDPSVRPIGKDGKFAFNTPKTAAALQRFADLALVHKVTPPDFGSLKDSDVKGGFQNKQYAMVVDATGFAPTLVGAKVNFDIYPHPTVNGNKLTVGAVGLIAVATMKDTVKRQAAMDLGRYLTSAEVQVDVPPGSNVPTGFYLAPGARKSVKVTAPLDLFIPMLPDMWITPLITNWAPLTRLIHPEYQNIIFGKIKPADSMTKIAPEADKMISGK